MITLRHDIANIWDNTKANPLMYTHVHDIPVKKYMNPIVKKLGYCLLVHPHKKAFWVDQLYRTTKLIVGYGAASHLILFHKLISMIENEIDRKLRIDRDKAKTQVKKARRKKRRGTIANRSKPLLKQDIRKRSSELRAKLVKEYKDELDSILDMIGKHPNVKNINKHRVKVNKFANEFKKS